MADKVARTHTHASNRVKAKEGGERKVVFKSVLDSPFRISWPSIPLNLQNSILAMLISLLGGVAPFQQHHREQIRKRKRESRREDSLKKRKISNDHGSSVLSTMDVDASQSSEAVAGILTRPPILDHIAVGINGVTKRLENQTKAVRSKVITAKSPSEELEGERNPLKVIFVCRADVNPHLLIDHFPHLVAAYNSSQAQETLKLVSLPKNAEAALQSALGLHRAAVVGLQAQSPGLQSLLPLLENVPALRAPWLAPSIPASLIPTHVKQIRTSMPKDLRAAKERRKDGRATAKQRRVAQKG